MGEPLSREDAVRLAMMAMDAHEQAEERVTELEKQLKDERQRVEELSAMSEFTCADCQDTGWLHNRVEGRYACTCMTEMEPYQELERELEMSKAFYRLVVKERDYERQRLDKEQALTARLLKSLTAAGFTDCGGELWRPPVNNAPERQLTLLKDAAQHLLNHWPCSDPDCCAAAREEAAARAALGEVLEAITAA
jgi:hypothetical protein